MKGIDFSKYCQVASFCYGRDTKYIQNIFNQVVETGYKKLPVALTYEEIEGLINSLDECFALRGVVTISKHELLYKFKTMMEA